MAVLHHDHEGHACIHVKGAPEAVLGLCADQRAAGRTAVAVAGHARCAKFQPDDAQLLDRAALDALQPGAEVDVLHVVRSRLLRIVDRSWPDPRLLPRRS